MAFFRKRKTQQSVYLDHAAGTPLDAAVFQAMKPYLTEHVANPSALYRGAVQAKQTIEQARKTIASFLHATDDSVIFSRGGTQSINMALLGAARSHRSLGNHIVTTQVEHHAVLHTLAQLEKEGFEVTYLPVDESGAVSAKQVQEALRHDTILVSVMYANNEIGTIEPIAEIGKMILQRRKKEKTPYPLFHTDACQAAGSLDMSVERLHVDLLSFNGSKIYGPKGVGVLYKRRGVEVDPTLFGGGQEFGFSPGTEDVAGIVGLGTAVSLISETKSENTIAALRDLLWKEIQTTIEDTVLNGPAREDERLHNNLNVSFLGADAEAIILYLDAKGIQVSSGSACTTDSDELSHVLTACGYDEARMMSSIRFSLGKGTTQNDIEHVLKALSEVVQKVRSMNS